MANVCRGTWIASLTKFFSLASSSAAWVASMASGSCGNWL